jgi:DNA-directed RNA polymerase specialized sigma24 family protein
MDVVDLASSGTTLDDALQKQHVRALVLAALDRIPLAKRAVLVMYDVDDVPMREVASVLEIPLFTAYSRLRTGRRDLEVAIRTLLQVGDVKKLLRTDIDQAVEEVACGASSDLF